MIALFGKHFTTKICCGLSGRIQKGKSADGKAYGYDVVRSLGEDGALKTDIRRLTCAPSSLQLARVLGIKSVILGGHFVHCLSLQ